MNYNRVYDTLDDIQILVCDIMGTLKRLPDDAQKEIGITANICKDILENLCKSIV